LIVAAVISGNRAMAAEAEFVGKLALAVENDVAKALGISDAVKRKLLVVIEQREEAALDLVLQIKDLDPAAQKAKLAPFVAESEALGLKLLSAAQKSKLEKFHMQRKGMRALGDPEVADHLSLTEDQRAQVKRLLDQFDANVARGRPEQVRIARMACEQGLSKLLLDEQRVVWGQLIDPAAPGTVPPPSVRVAQADNVDQPKADADPDGDDKANAEKGDDFEPAPPRVEPENDDKGDPAAAPQPAAVADDQPKPAGDGKLRFSFRYAPWQDVLDWFATEAGLSLHADAPPPGTFNYTDSRRYTPAEAIDVINSILLTKGFTLVRREKALILVNLEDGIPPNLVQRVAEQELDDRGEFELVSCLFALDILTPEEAETEIRKLLGPQGAVVVLPKAKQILVTETAGRLRTIRDVIHAVEKPDLTSDQKLTVYELRHATADEVMVMVRQLLGLPEGSNAAADGSLRVAVDALGSRLVVTGKVEQVKRVDEIVKLADVPLEDGAADLANLEPQLEVYSIPLADPTTVLQVLQTILAGDEETRLTVDEATGNLVALASPSQHATIRATIAQMERDAKQVEVIRLRVVDPQLAVLAINRLFGVGEEGSAKNAPRVEAELTTRQLLIRGTQGQISQIRTLLEKMGETSSDDDITGIADRRHTRSIPFTADELRDLLPKVERAWLRRNRILIDPPLLLEGAGGDEGGELDLPARAPLRQSTDGFIPEKRPDEFQRFDLTPRPKSDRPPAVEPEEKKTPENESPPLPPNPKDNSSAARSVRPLIRLIADDGEGEATEEPAPEADPQPNEDEPTPADNDPPLLLVLPGSEGSVIASKDLDALDEFENLLSTLAAKAAARPSFTVFYLKYAKSRTAAELLKEILGGGSSSDSGGGGGLLGDLAGAAMGNLGGDLLGGLLGIGGADGTVTSIGSVTFVPDSRLNAIFVQGEPTDIDVVERLLRIIDQEASPEDVQTFARPRIIPVVNSSALEISQVVRQVYAEQLGSSSNQQRQPSPEQIIRALRGGRGGREGQSREEEKQKMTMSVDERNNLLIVAAEESLFQEVKALVEQLDFVRPESQQVMRVITLKRIDPAMMQQALSSIAGDSIQMGTTSAPSSGRGQRPRDPATAQMQQMMDFINGVNTFNSAQRMGRATPETANVFRALQEGGRRDRTNRDDRMRQFRENLGGGNQGGAPPRPTPRGR
jgi:type II secretory pathway component GspD/PulD (secretin)